MNRGDIISVMPHSIHGYTWTVGKIGVVLSQARTSYWHRDWGMTEPALKPGWWVVSLGHPVAKNGYAYAALPEEFLGPHNCTVNCPKHLSL